MASSTVLMVGTRKGLWIGRSDEAREEWTWTGPHADMEEVYSCAVDTRGGRVRLLAGSSSMWLGPRVRRSEDLGATWEQADDVGRSFALCRGLWDHRDREAWGAGFGGQAFHTILPHPTDPDSVTVAISTGGVYQTRDGGRSWEPRNRGIRAEFLPEGQQYPEFG